MHIYRGNIYYADLNPAIGCEQGGVRPVLILQNNTGNKYSPTLIVAAMTKQHKTSLPTHVLVDAKTTGLAKDSLILLEQIRTIDKARLKGFVGNVPLAKMKEVDEALHISFRLD